MYKNTFQYISLFSLFFTVAEAAVTLDSLASSSGTSFVTGPTSFIFADEAIAVQVTTDAQQWELQSVEISWAAQPFGLGATNAEVEIYTIGDPFSAGSTVSQTLSGETTPVSSIETYTPTSTITLNPGSSLWLLLHVPTGDGDYAVNTSLLGSATGPWSVTDQRARVIGSWFPATAIPSLRFNAVAVPEPSAALLSGLALLGLCQRRRLR